MDLETILKLINEIGPYTPRIAKAKKTAARLLADPDVRDAIELGKELAAKFGPMLDPAKPGA